VVCCGRTSEAIFYHILFIYQILKGGGKESLRTELRKSLFFSIGISTSPHMPSSHADLHRHPSTRPAGTPVHAPQLPALHCAPRTKNNPATCPVLAVLRPPLKMKTNPCFPMLQTHVQAHKHTIARGLAEQHIYSAKPLLV